MRLAEIGLLYWDVYWDFQLKTSLSCYLFSVASGDRLRVLSDWGNCDIQDPGPLLTVFEIKVILYVFLFSEIWLLFLIKCPSAFGYFKKVLPAALLISSSYPLSGKAPSSQKEGPHNFIPLIIVYNNMYYRYNNQYPLFTLHAHHLLLPLPTIPLGNLYTFCRIELHLYLVIS